MSALDRIKNVARFAHLAANDLTPLQGGGLSHDHVVLGVTGWLLRVPRGNQLGMKPADFLNLQKACYDQAHASGHTPRCLGILPPSDDLPNGALIVEKINGRKARVPDDYAAIGQALAALHRILPPVEAAPLQVAAYPFESQRVLLNEIFGAAAISAPIDTATRDLIEVERAQLLNFLDDPKLRGDSPQTLIGADSHPGNFMIDDTGRAVLVDLEFATYDAPYIDLADASMPITTRLDPAMGVVTDEPARSVLYNSWRHNAAPEQAQKLDRFRPWAERLVQMRTLLWLCDWLAQGQKNIQAHVQQRTIENWNAMARSYLEHGNLKRLLHQGVTPQLVI